MFNFFMINSIIQVNVILNYFFNNEKKKKKGNLAYDWLNEQILKKIGIYCEYVEFVLVVGVQKSRCPQAVSHH